MSNPLYISDCVRKDGVTFLVVEGHELTEADQDRTLYVTGVSDRSVNGTHRISRVVPPSTIEFLQPGQVDIPAGIRGGAVAIEGEAIPPAHPEGEKIKPVETEVPEEAAKHPAKEPEKHPEPAHKPNPAPAPKTHK